MIDTKRFIKYGAILEKDTAVRETWLYKDDISHQTPEFIGKVVAEGLKHFTKNKRMVIGFNLELGDLLVFETLLLDKDDKNISSLLEEI